MCFIKVNVIVFLCRNRIRGVMISMLVSSAVDRGFESRSGQLLNWYLFTEIYSAKYLLKSVMLSVQSSLLCPQLLNRKHHMGMSMLPCISYCNLSINNIHSGEWETCSKGRSLAALCESSYRQEAIGRLIYRYTIFCTLKT
jgi:hypothetical protein